MIKVSLPDGSVKEFENGTSGMDVAKSISHGLARNVLSGSYNGETIELNDPLNGDGDLVLFTWNDEDGKKAFWHSSAHIMAQAITHMFPKAKLTIGPPIERGFYYDVDFGEETLHEKDFVALEKKFVELARTKAEFKMRSVSKADALNYYSANPFKTELIENLEDGTITFVITVISLTYAVVGISRIPVMSRHSR